MSSPLALSVLHLIIHHSILISASMQPSISSSCTVRSKQIIPRGSLDLMFHFPPDNRRMIDAYSGFRPTGYASVHQPGSSSDSANFDHWGGQREESKRSGSSDPNRCCSSAAMMVIACEVILMTSNKRQPSSQSVSITIETG